MKRLLKKSRASDAVFIILLTAFLFFLAVPLFNGIVISFTDWTGLAKEYNFIGFDNYVKIFKDVRTVSALLTTLKYLLLLLPASIIFGYINASVICRIKLFQSQTLLIFFFPYVVTPVVVSMLWNQLYYRLLTAIGSMLNIAVLESNILSNKAFALIAIAIVDLWMLIPYTTLLFYSAINAIPQNLIDSAKLDGAGKFNLFLYIKLPYLLPIIGMIVTVIFSYALTSIDTIMALTGGGPGRSTETLYYAIYRNSTLDQRYAFGSAEGLLVTIASIIVYLMISRITNGKNLNDLSLED